MSPSTSARCGHCSSSAVNLSRSLYSSSLLYDCEDCGEVTPYAVAHPEEAGFFCRECYQPMEVRETSPGVFEDYHEVDLPFPRCAIHKAEKVQARRASFRLIQGTA